MWKISWGRSRAADSLPFDERPAKHIVHVGSHCLRVARSTLAHRELDDVGKDPCVHEQLAVFEVRRLHRQARMSLRVQRGLPDRRPQPIAEGVLAALATFPIDVQIVVAQRPDDPPAEPVRLRGEAMDEVEHLLQMAPVAHVSGEHERAVAREPMVERIDEAECAEDLLQRLQLAVDVANHAHPFRAVSEKLRDVAMRGQAPLDGHVFHADVLHLKDVQLVRRESR